MAASIVLLSMSIRSLMSWLSLYGFVLELEESPIMRMALGLLFLPLGLIYSFIPGLRLGTSITTSVVITLTTITINVLFYVFVLFQNAIQAETLSFALMYITIFLPISLIAFIVSIVFAVMALFKKHPSPAGN